MSDGSPSEIALHFLDLLQDNDFYEIDAMCTRDCRVLFLRSGLTVPIRDFLSEKIKLFQSFPDYKIIVHNSVSDPKLMKAKITLHTTGTHTGKAYAYREFPAIPTTGIKVTNEVQVMTMQLTRDRMIRSISITSDSDLASPTGFYIQIGGRIKA